MLVLTIAQPCRPRAVERLGRKYQQTMGLTFTSRGVPASTWPYLYFCEPTLQISPSQSKDDIVGLKVGGITAALLQGIALGVIMATILQISLYFVTMD